MRHGYIFSIILACVIGSSGIETVASAEAVSTKSTVSFRHPSKSEEFGIIWHTLKMMPFYNRYGYRVGLPRHEAFRRLAQQPDMLKNTDRKRLYAVFADQEYDKASYENGLRALESEAETVHKALAALSPLKRLWGFELYDHYDVVLTLYGPGGTYDPSSGRVFIKTTTGGRFARGEPIHTVVHEIVHLGTHRRIKEKFDLRHNEVEKVVDHICTTQLGHILTGYQAMSRKNEHLERFLDTNAVINLPQAVESYQNSVVAVLVVEKIYEGSQAKKLRLKVGDFIYTYDGTRTTGSNEFAQLVRARSGKREIEMNVFRKGKIHTFSLKGGPIGVKIAEAKIARKNLPID